MADTTYVDAKTRILRCLLKLKSFLQASVDFSNDRTNSGKRAKIGKMLIEVTNLRTVVEDDIERMELAVNSLMAPAEIVNINN